MAEAAAIAYGVAEAIETSAQVGVGAYMLAKPTMPLKATFTQIATAADDDTRLSLARSDHTLTIVGHKAYIFGGETASGKLASNEIHIVNLDGSEANTEPAYSVKAALPASENGKVPVARTKHAACAFNNTHVAIFGGVDQEGKTIDEGSAIWLFNTENSTWETLEASVEKHASPSLRRSARLFSSKARIILYGGIDSSGTSLHDIWAFETEEKAWSRLPDAPVSTSNAAVSENVLYLVSANDNVSSDTHFLPLGSKEDEEPHSWTTIPFPTNPLTPGPRARTEAGLMRVSTGYGRNYLVYLFGMHPEKTPVTEERPSQTETSTTKETEKNSEEEEPPLYHSDTWTYQLPSSHPELKATTQIYEALKPAALKDAIRGALGFNSGKHSWGEAEIVPPTDLLTSAAGGKVHPGPRARFGGDVMADGKGVVVWGGVNPKGEREGDGWMIRFS